MSRPYHVVYEEKQPFRLLIYIMVGVMLFAITAAFLSGESEAMIPMGAMFLIMFSLILFFRNLEIKLTQEELSVGFRFIRSVVKVKDITHCEATKIKFGTYMGMGMRYGVDGTKCFNTRFGDAVKIEAEGQKRTLVFSCDRPQRLCDSIKSLMKK